MSIDAVKRTLRTPKSEDNYLIGLVNCGEYTTINSAYSDAIRKGVRALKRERKE